MPEYIQVAGKSNIYLGFYDQSASSALVKLGEQLDDTRIEVVNMSIDVHGDRHGGQSGPPIEKQILGQMCRGQLNLSRFDPALLVDIHKHRAFNTHGAVEDHEVGMLLMRDRSFRLVIVPAPSMPGAQAGGNVNLQQVPDVPGVGSPFIWNFVCCTFVSQPVSMGQGTKFSLLNVNFEAHRAPEGHAKEGVVWDRDLTGVPQS